jgi:hypothetical protein
MAPDQVPGGLRPDTSPTEAQVSAYSTGPSDQAQGPVSSYVPLDDRHVYMPPQVLSPTAPTAPAPLDDQALHLASTSAPPTPLESASALGLVLNVAPALSMPRPPTLVPGSSSVAAPGSSTPTALVSDPAPPRTRLQEGICKPKFFSNGTVRYAYSTNSGSPTRSRKHCHLLIGRPQWWMSIMRSCIIRRGL